MILTILYVLSAEGLKSSSELLIDTKVLHNILSNDIQFHLPLNVYFTLQLVRIPLISGVLYCRAEIFLFTMEK